MSEPVRHIAVKVDGASIEPPAGTSFVPVAVSDELRQQLEAAGEVQLSGCGAACKFEFRDDGTANIVLTQGRREEH